ncbi:MAG TPA: hypothetical protein VNW71_20685 [Thermoanaerobaculia bacterium]|nr:hypothetical protein [Thermoanaerobaculia bacterium]
MTKKLSALMCALILTGFGALAAAEPASTSPSVEPSQAVASAPTASPVACAQTLSSILVPAPIPMMGPCQGWLYGSCDRRADCTGFSCPLGEVKTCVGGTGSGCNGTCECVW